MATKRYQVELRNSSTKIVTTVLANGEFEAVQIAEKQNPGFKVVSVRPL